MYHGDWSLWGMHFFWWLFWIGLIMLMFTPFAPVTPGRRHATPLDILQRRYASGEITTAEYEERKAKLERDTRAVK